MKTKKYRWLYSSLCVAVNGKAFTPDQKDGSSNLSWRATKYCSPGTLACRGYCIPFAGFVGRGDFEHG